MKTKRPNVVLMISHDTGRFYGAYGITTVNTPNFDALAQQSTTFDRCFCMTPLCAPARAALVSGRYPAPERHERTSGQCARQLGHDRKRQTSRQYLKEQRLSGRDLRFRA